MPNWALDPTSVASVIASAGTAIGIVFASLQLHDGRKTARGEFLHSLELDVVNRHAICLKIMQGEDLSQVQHRIEISSFVSLCEKIKILLDDGIIDLPTVNHLFAGRFFTVVDHPWIADVLCNGGYEGFSLATFALHKQLRDYRKETGIDQRGSDLRTELEQRKEKYDSFVALYNRSRRPGRLAPWARAYRKLARQFAPSRRSLQPPQPQTDIASLSNFEQP